VRFWLLLFLRNALLVVSSGSDHQSDDDGWPLSSSTVVSCSDAATAIQQFVKDGRLSAARSLAQTIPPQCEKQVSKAYMEEADRLLETALAAKSEDDGSSLFQQQLVTSSFKSDRAQATIDDAWICSIVDTETLVKGDYWEKCCSSLWEYTVTAANNRSLLLPHDQHQPGECFPDGIPVCCEFFQGSPSHLRLPVLREVAIRLRVILDDREIRFLALEQDGLLRPFDVSTVQWPAGYFLALCVAAPIKCGIPQLETVLTSHSSSSHHHPIAIELGSGIGASSMALAMATLSLNSQVQHSGPAPLIIATDHSLQALALSTANVAANSLSEAIKIQRMDHFDMEQVQQLKESYFGGVSSDDDDEDEGFSLVLGSSLLSFFVDTNHPNAPLWQALDILLHNNSKPNKPPALALLVHGKVDPIHPPSDGSFRLVGRISGDSVDMQTRSSASSDFELSIFERCSSSNDDDDDGSSRRRRASSSEPVKAASGEGEL